MSVVWPAGLQINTLIFRSDRFITVLIDRKTSYGSMKYSSITNLACDLISQGQLHDETVTPIQVGNLEISVSFIQCYVDF